MRTSPGGSNEDHADLLRGRRVARGALLEAFDARVEGRDDILELLKLVFDEAHGCGLRQTDTGSIAV